MPHKINEEDSMMEKKVKEKYTGPRVKDTETFIQKARWVHGDKYDYSRVAYRSARSKVKIVCDTHGDFLQTPEAHFSGRGCQSCGKEKAWDVRGRVTTEDFVAKAKKSHGDRYNYSRTNYVNNVTPVEIICSNHGSFFQTPANHLLGRGCQVCAGNIKKTTTSFILDAQSIHGDRYNYRDVQYKDSHTKVKIICKEHGSFFQAPANHLSGNGCILCRGERAWDSRGRVTTEDFVSLAREIHGNLYEYSKCRYKDSHTKVKIICKEHGEFLQKPANHLYKKSGCPYCAGKRLSTKQWIKRFNETHGYKYDYSKVEYTLSQNKVTIICPSHGEFSQSPNSHFRGAGCLECSLERGGYGVNGYYGTSSPANIYVLKLNDSFIKVGLAKEIHSRMGKLNKESGYSVEKLYSISGKANELFELEQKILRRSNLKRFYPEVSFGGQSECLELSELPKVLDIIEEWEKNQQNEEEIEEGA